MENAEAPAPQVTTIKFDGEVRARLDQLRRVTRTPLSAMVNLLLTEALDARAAKVTR